MKAFFCELILSCTLAATAAKPVDELTYGTVLFAYYQQDYQQALLDSLVAEAQGRRGDNPVRFELAKGSFAFSDGMYRYARETFEAVDPAELTDIDRMRLAFHLAREYHRRGDWAEVEAGVAQIDLGRSWLGRRKFHPEVEFMRAEAAIQRGDFAAAENALKLLDEDDAWLAYGLFNLGVAYRAADDLAAAERVFTRLAGMEPETDEAHDLVQRAKLALAFIARARNKISDAEQVLGALPASGRYRDIALASYGGLAMDTGDYELAARIWLTLQNQTYWTASTAQARLGFPVSLEKLASQEMALAQFRAAERAFEARLAKLESLSERAEDPAWVHGLLLAFSAPEQDGERMGELMERWREQLGHTDWLEWLATERVHEVLMEWRELLGMRKWLGLLPERLAAFEALAGEQQRRSAAARGLLHDREVLATREVLTARVTALEGTIADLKAAPPAPDRSWMNKLADDEQREVLADLEVMSGLVSRHMTERERARWEKRIRRLEGVLFWELVDRSSARIRELEKQLGENRNLLSEVDERITRVAEAEDNFVAGVGTNFLLFSERARAITADVDAALEDREATLAAEIRRGMQREMREVEEYLLIARIAVARATDLLAEGGPPAAAFDGGGG